MTASSPANLRLSMFGCTRNSLLTLWIGLPLPQAGEGRGEGGRANDKLSYLWTFKRQKMDLNMLFANPNRPHPSPAFQTRRLREKGLYHCLDSCRYRGDLIEIPPINTSHSYASSPHSRAARPFQYTQAQKGFCTPYRQHRPRPSLSSSQQPAPRHA